MEQAKVAEHGYRHSAIIHSTNVGNMTHKGRQMDTTIFVKNGPCVAGLGLGGRLSELFRRHNHRRGHHTIQDVYQIRRCVMVENLRIV